MRKISIIAAALVISGCATFAPQPPVAISTPFDSAAHSAYAVAGSGAVKGQAFLRQQGGGVVTCAGSEVMLIPSTPYFSEALDIARSGRQIQPAHVEAQELVKQSTCDAQGNFQFSDVAAGAWFVTTEVAWVVGYNSQGGGLLAEISVSDDQVTEILLTDSHRVGW